MMCSFERPQGWIHVSAIHILGDQLQAACSGNNGLETNLRNVTPGSYFYGKLVLTAGQDMKQDGPGDSGRVHDKAEPPNQKAFSA